MAEIVKTHHGRQETQDTEGMSRSRSTLPDTPRRAREILSVERDFFERQAGRKHEFHRKLGGIWSPGLVRSSQTRSFFEALPYAGEVSYGRPLFADQPNYTETLFGGMAYHVDREVVLSFKNRLTEVGALHLSRPDATVARAPFVLQENHSTTARPGEQAVIYSGNQVPDGIDMRFFEAALVKAYDVPGGVSIRKKNGPRAGGRHYDVRFEIPAAISWDGLNHTVRLRFSARLPQQTGGNATTRLFEFFGAVNGRPAQHYQHEAATVIRLEELIFAKGTSVKLTLDPGTAAEQQLEPDRILGAKLVLLLSQTAGGFFEKAFWQTQDGQNLKTTLESPDGQSHGARQVSHMSYDENDQEQRVTTWSFFSAPHKTRIAENHLVLPNGRSVFEMSELKFLDAKDNRELMAVSFNTGIGRGIRDLGFFHDKKQIGRFAFRVDGITGFAYGDFVVSPTRQIGIDDQGSPRYYTSIVLTPRFSRDMKNKLIILHVLHTQDGVYTETQIVPRKVVHASGTL